MTEIIFWGLCCRVSHESGVFPPLFLTGIRILIRTGIRICVTEAHVHVRSTITIQVWPLCTNMSCSHCSISWSSFPCASSLRLNRCFLGLIFIHSCGMDLITHIPLQGSSISAITKKIKHRRYDTLPMQKVPEITSGYLRAMKPPQHEHRQHEKEQVHQRREFLVPKVHKCVQIVLFHGHADPFVLLPQVAQDRCHD